MANGHAGFLDCPWKYAYRKLALLNRSRERALFPFDTAEGKQHAQHQGKAHRHVIYTFCTKPATMKPTTQTHATVST